MPAARPDMPAPMISVSYMRSVSEIANCKLQISNCKLPIDVPQFAICIFHFAICISDATRTLGVLAFDVAHEGFEVRDRRVHAGEVDVVVFGNLHAVAFAELHDDIQEVHAIELELLAEALLVVELREVFIGGDVAEDI